MAHRIWSLLAALLFCLPMPARPLVCARMDGVTPTPASRLTCVFQDSEGYMWYGTENGGLYRDDGYAADVFRSDYANRGMLRSNHVTCISEDNRHRIWFGTKRGLYILDKKTHSITAAADNSPAPRQIDALLCTSAGDVWVSANDCMLRYGDDGRLKGTQYVLYKGQRRSTSHIMEDSRKTVWMIQWRGGLFKFDTKAGRFVSCRWPYAESPSSISEDTSGSNLLIAAWGRGIVSYDKTTGHYRTMTLPAKSGNPPTHITYMLTDSRRSILWTASETNLTPYGLASGRITESGATVDGLPDGDKTVNGLLADRDGNIWVPAYYPYSFILSDPAATTEHHIPDRRAFSGKTVLPMAFAVQGSKIWFCQRRDGIYSYDTSTGQLRRMVADRSDTGGMVRAARNGGVYTVSRRTEVWLANDGEPRRIVSLPQGELIHDMAEDNDGNLWICTSSGVWKNGAGDTSPAKVISGTGVVNRIVTSAGRVYAATETGGLLEYHGGQLRRIFPAGENFSALAAGTDGTVWAGTLQGSVLRYDARAGTKKNMTAECGLTGDAVVSLETDRHGWVWILTGRRVTVYNLAEKTARTFAGSSRDVRMESLMSLARGRNGQVLIGGTGGFCAITPSDNVAAAHHALRLTAFRIGGRRTLAGTGDSTIHLRPDERDVELYFSTLDYLNARKIRYAFRQSGSDGWNYISEGQNSIYLTQLSRGGHHIEVRATDAAGKWGAAPIRLTVYRAPAWYETDTAFAVYALLAAALIYLGIRFYTDIKRRKIIDNQITNSARDIQMLVGQLADGLPDKDSGHPDKPDTALANIHDLLVRHAEKDENSGNGNTQADAGNRLTPADERFVRKALECIERNIGNSDYSVEQLSHDLAMERTGLYRKLMSIIGKTPTAFIRSARLKRAAELMRQGCSVSQAADMSGFGTASYLGKCFLKEYGMRPSEYIASHAKQ